MITYNIAIDADDVLDNLLEVWIEELNARHNLNYSVDDMTRWNMAHNITELTEEQIYEPLYDDAIWERLMPVNGSVDALKTLQEMGHNVFVCTRHTIFETIKTKLFRLQELFPMIPADHYIIAANKNMIKADIMIDDGTHNLASVEHPCIKILYDRPHNHHVDTDFTDMIRATTWDDVLLIISTLSNTDIMANWVDIMVDRMDCEGCFDEIE